MASDTVCGLVSSHLDTVFSCLIGLSILMSSMSIPKKNSFPSHLPSSTPAPPPSSFGPFLMPNIWSVFDFFFCLCLSPSLPSSFPPLPSLHLSLSLSFYSWAVACESQKSCWFPGASIIDSCKLPSMSAGTWIQILCKSSIYFLYGALTHQQTLW